VLRSGCICISFLPTRGDKSPHGPVVHYRPPQHAPQRRPAQFRRKRCGFLCTTTCPPIRQRYHCLRCIVIAMIQNSCCTVQCSRMLVIEGIENRSRNAGKKRTSYAQCNHRQMCKECPPPHRHRSARDARFSRPAWLIQLDRTPPAPTPSEFEYPCPKLPPPPPPPTEGLPALLGLASLSAGIAR
jgi:hypothetical protein